ncbi:MAG: septum formation initiator family protein [Pseudomonadota bacterium]
MLKKHVVDVGVGLFVLAAILHFGHRGVQGESGLFVRLAIEKEARQLTMERDLLASRRADLENLTKRLSESYLDLDLLDERARDVLGYVAENEVVIR